MARIPVLGGPSLMPDDRNRVTQPQQRNPDYGAAQALGAVTQTLGQVGNQVGSAIQSQQDQAQREANALVEADAALAWGTVADKEMAALRSQRGIAASEMSGQTLESIEKARDEVASGIKDPRARTDFKVRSSQQLLAYRRQVEEYTGRQLDVAKEATATARAGQVMAMAESGISDFESYKETLGFAEQNIRALAPSPVAGEAAVERLRADSGAAFIGGMLAQGRIDDAAKFVDENRDTLGSKYVEAKGAVDRALAGVKKDRAELEIAGLVARAADRVKDSYGYVSENSLREVLSPEGAALPEEVEKQLEKRVRIEAAKLDNDKKDARNIAEDAVNRGQSIPGATREFMSAYDAKYLRGLDDDVKSNYRRWKSERDGTKREADAARREQSQANRDAINEYRARLNDDPNADPVAFAREWSDGRDVGVNASGISEMKRWGSGAAKGADTTLGAAKRNAANDFEADLRANARGLKQKISEEEIQRRKGAFLAEYDRFAEANGGKPLDAEAQAELGARALRKTKVTKEKSILGIIKYQGEADALGVDTFAPPGDASSTPAPTKAVRMKFPNGAVYEIAPDKVDAARRKGGIIDGN